VGEGGIEERKGKEEKGKEREKERDAYTATLHEISYLGSVALLPTQCH
jgi:hypothetical protein